MKLIQILLLIISVFLCSCGVFSKYGLLSSYHGDYFDMYHAQLSQEDIKRLNKGEEVYMQYEMNWPDHYYAGPLRVLPTDKQDVYNFIEIGVWKKEGKFQLKAGFLYYKGEEVFDSLGNIISYKYLEKQPDQDSFILRQEWKLVKEVIDGKPFNLIYTIAYSEIGIPVIDYWYDQPEFQIAKSHANKKRIFVKSKKEYKKDGTLKKETLYDMAGKVIESRKS